MDLDLGAGSQGGLPLPPPLRLAGYAVGELLGVGGSGEVWAATETATGRAVALKRLRGSTPASIAELVRREGAILTSVAGPHIIPIDRVIVEHPLPGAGASGAEEADPVAVLVLPRAAGGSLAALLAARVRLPAPEVVTVLAPVAAALAAVHARELIHGDLSPGNVLFTTDGRPLVADFGLARLVGSGGAAAQVTAGFVAPEVQAGERPGPQADVWSLGALGVAMLTGTPPVLGADPREQLAAVENPATLTLLDAVVDALTPDPYGRPTAREMSVALLHAHAAAPVRLVRPPPGLPTVVTADREPMAPTTVPPVPVPIDRWWRRQSPVEEPRDLGGHRDLGDRGGLWDLGLAGDAGQHSDGDQAEPDSRRGGVRPGAPVRLSRPHLDRATRVGPVRRLAPGTVHPPARAGMRRLAVAAAAFLAVAVAVLAGLTWGGHSTSGTAATLSAHTAPGGSASGDSASGGATAGSTAPGGDTGWRRAVTALGDRRDAALAAGNSRDLAAVYAPGSPALAADQAMAASLRSRGLRIVGLHTAVSEASLVRATADTATVVVRERVSAYRVEAADGTAVGRGPGASEHVVVLHLDRVEGSWRVDTASE